MSEFDQFTLIGKNRSDSIRKIIIGPWVSGMVAVFEQIDFVRREDGFNASFVDKLYPERARRKEIDRFLARIREEPDA